MAVPFSNTHLRVPRGFATILEGLAREVLRNQPEDIPAYAALYFNGLLKEREESGMDPAEWAAKLEDRFYNNHAFKASPAKEPAPEVTTSSEEKSSESQTEDESEDESPSTADPNVSEEVHATENKGEEEKDKKLRRTEEDVISTEMELSQESDNRLPVTDVRSDELSGTEEEKDPTITIPDQVDTAANENDSRSSLDKDICQSELEPADLSSFSGNSNVDVCSEELGKIEDRGDQTYQKQETKDGDEEIRESTGEEQSAEFEEPMEEFPYSGLADVNVCAEELGRTDATVEGATVDDDPSDVHTAQQESSIPQMEEAIVKASLSQTEAPEANLQELDDQAEETVEGEGIETEPCSGETHDILATTENALEQMPQTEEVLGSDAAPKEEALVEISFEDVPEVSEIVEKQPVEADLVESSQTEVLEMQHHEESEEFTEVETDHNIHSTQDHDEPEMEVVENEVQTEGDKTSQQEAEDTVMEKLDTIDSDSSDSESDSDDDERGEGVKNISSSHQPTTEAEGENLEDETDHDSEDQDNKEISESESHQIEYSEIEETKFETNDPDIKDDEKIAMGGEDIEDIETQGFRELEEKLSQEIDDGCAETSLLQANHSNVSKPEKEAESETVEESAEILPDESEEREKTPVKLQPEDTAEEIEVKSKQPVSKAEELLEEGTIESEGQGKIEAAREEGSVGPTQSADQTDDDNLEEHGPLGSEKDTAEPEGKRDDKQEECSRPQEEEDIMDIPLDDPEANKAAAKIQAGFRGHMTRKKMKPEDKAEGEEVSSTGEALNGSQGDTETGGSGAVERDDTSIPEQ